MNSPFLLCHPTTINQNHHSKPNFPTYSKKPITHQTQKISSTQTNPEKFQQIVGQATTNKSKTTSVKAASHPRHKHLKIGNPTTPNRHHPTPTVNPAINNPPNRKVSTRSTVIRPRVAAKSHAGSPSRQTPPPSATTGLHLHSPTSADRKPRRAATSCYPFIPEPSHRRLKTSTWSLSYPDSGVFQTFNPILSCYLFFFHNVSFFFFFFFFFFTRPTKYSSHLYQPINQQTK
jgi:hypothetical protein